MSRVLLTTALSLTCAFAAHAGEYMASNAVPANGFAVSNADLKATGVPKKRGAQPISPSQIGFPNSFTTTKIFTWVPDGPLEDDPAPTSEALQTSTIIGGPIVATIDGAEYVSASAYFFVNDSNNLVAIVGAQAKPPTFPSPATTPAPAQPSVTPIPGSQIQLYPNNGQLHVRGQVTATSSTYMNLFPAVKGESKFNSIKIKLSDITLKP